LIERENRTMNIISKRAASRLPIALTTIAVTTSLALWGCYADAPTDPLPGSSAGSGGDSAQPPSSDAGVGSVGGNAPVPEPVENEDAGSGGAEDVSTATGGAAPASAGTSTGGLGGLGGSAPIAGAGHAGESHASGGSSTQSGGTHVGGTVAAAGVGGDATGGTAGGTAGGGGGGGAGGNPPVSEPICADEEGFPVPYDFSYGLASEYAFELSMNCDVGGYMLPLVLADPEQLSQVAIFVDVATAWYRAEILRCEGEQTELGSDAYGLLPVSESDELSDADFDASMELFVSIVSRHDGLPDGVSPHKKNKIKERIKSVKARAVHNNTKALTRPLSEPDCVPALPSED
jgi:hypothetical protein